MYQTNRVFLKILFYTLLVFLGNAAYAEKPSNQTPTHTDAKSNSAVSATKAQATQNYHLSGHVENGVRVVEVRSFKYGFNPDPIVVKVGEKVRLLLTTKDVMHGFGIADLEINVKIPPKKTTAFEFIPKKAGTYHIHCTIYCGLGHGSMHGTLVINK